MEGGLTGLGEKVQHVALLLAQCGADREHAFDEPTAVRTVGPEAGVAPDDTVAQGALGGVATPSLRTKVHSAASTFNRLEQVAAVCSSARSVPYNSCMWTWCRSLLT